MAAAHSKTSKVIGFLLSPFSVVFLLTFFVNLFVVWFWFSTYRIWNFDLAWQTQVVASYAKLSVPIVSFVADNFNALGNHFSPILALAAPVYAIFPHSFTLNVLMAFCFALSAAILAKTAHDLLNKKYAYLLGIILGVSWAFLTASSAQFHEYALGAPLLAYSLSRFLKKDYLKAAIFAGLLVLVKEDVGLILAGLGVVFSLRSKDWRYLTLSIFGVFWSVFTIRLLIPLIGGGSWLFGSLLNVSISGFFADFGAKILLLVFLILSSGIIGLRSPLFYAPLLFVFARFFSTTDSFYAIGYHYDTLTIIIVSFALLDSLVQYDWKPLVRRVAVWIPIALTIFYLLVPLSGSRSYLTRNYSLDRGVIADYQGLFAAIPKGSIVAAENSTIAGFIDRGYRTYFIRFLDDRKPFPDCIVNDSEEIVNQDGVLLTTIPKFSEKTGRNYELVYESKTISAWCASK